MNKPALLKLAQLLRKPLPKGVDRFDMSNWKVSDDYCGTCACAAGCAASDPWFQKRGLTLRLGSRSPIRNWRRYTLHFNQAVGMSALLLFFGTNYDETEYIFYRDSYKRGNRLDVARRIEGFVRRRKV